MPNQVQAGTMIVRQSMILQLLGLESEPYYNNWRSLGTVDSSGLDHSLRTAGWNLFFMAEELRAVVPAWGGQNTVRRGLKAAPDSNSATAFQLPGSEPHTQETLPGHSVCVHSRAPTPYSGRLQASVE